MIALWIALALLAAFAVFVVGVVLGAARLNARRRRELSPETIARLMRDDG